MKCLMQESIEYSSATNFQQLLLSRTSSAAAPEALLSEEKKELKNSVHVRPNGVGLRRVTLKRGTHT